MAFYKHAKFLSRNPHENFDLLQEPGVDAADAGIYRCEVCGQEIGIAQTHKLPPQSHHTHAAGSGPIRWQLIVATQN